VESSRIAGAKRRLVVAKRFTAGVAAVAFGVTFVAIRSGGAATSTAKKATTAAKQTQTKTQTQTTNAQSQQSFFGNSNVGSSSGAAPSVSSSTS
jgi:hypothetical protein